VQEHSAEDERYQPDVDDLDIIVHHQLAAGENVAITGGKLGVGVFVTATASIDNIRLVDGGSGVHRGADVVYHMAVHTDCDCFPAPLDRPTVIGILVAFDHLCREAISCCHSRVGMALAAGLLGEMGRIGGCVGVFDVQDQVLVVAVGAGRRVLDTEGDGATVD